MKGKPLRSRLIAGLIFCAALLPAISSQAQYCSPSLGSCTSWGSQSVTLGTLNWTLGSQPCTDNDYTWMSTNLTTGFAHAMNVSNGDWCGCAVWIDLNQDNAFDPSENMFYSYLANQTNNYSFTITIPNGTAVGTYRMRVISPWGSDGFTTSNGNGQGPCGTYLYGSFQDFTIFVTGPQGLHDPAAGSAALFSVQQDPARETVQVTLAHGASAHGDLRMLDAAGRTVLERDVSGASTTIGTGSMPHGVYLLQYREGDRRQTARVIL
jgi:hypothetical protein